MCLNGAVLEKYRQMILTLLMLQVCRSYRAPGWGCTTAHGEEMNIDNIVGSAVTLHRLASFTDLRDSWVAIIAVATITLHPLMQIVNTSVMWQVRARGTVLAYRLGRADLPRVFPAAIPAAASALRRFVAQVRVLSCASHTLSR
jgi:hypothetical protein